MAEGGEVQPDLVRSPCDRLHIQPGPVSEPLEHSPVGLRRPAGFMIDLIPRRPGGIAGDGQIDEAA